MKIYFIRHGETIWNKEKKIQGQSDIPLNEYGRELAHVFFVVLPITLTIALCTDILHYLLKT